jgi:hypothetical protein
MPSLLGRQRIISPTLQEIRRYAYEKPRRFIEKNIKIADLTGNVVPFKLNWAQRTVNELLEEEKRLGNPVRYWFLKWRRAGITSFISAKGFVRIWSKDNARVGIIAHQEDRAAEILQNYKFYYGSLDPELQLQLSRDNIYGVKFEQTGAQALIGTCENPVKVRGDGMHDLQGSEAAHWGRQFGITAREVAPVVPDKPDTSIIYESTGSIRGCQAHIHATEAKEGRNEFKYKFLCWLNDPECSIPFESDLHQATVMEEMHAIEPRMTELIKYYQLTPGQAHQAWRFFHYKSDNNFDYFCREFPIREEFAWSAGGASFFGQLEINKATSQRPMRIVKFDGQYINQVFTDFNTLPKVDSIEDYSPFPNIKFWAMPSPSGRYAIGADSALGEEYGDYSYGSVRNIATRELMATFHGRLQPAETAHLMVSLARMYNNATLGPECNQGGGGLTILQDIQRIGYHRIYRWRKRDSFEGLKLSNSLGWWTTARSRPMMLGEMRKIFIDCIHGRLPAENIFRDAALINEMRTFVPDLNSNIPKALKGCYDDRVLGDAITHQICADEAFCTDKDLMHSYHKFERSKGVSQEKLVQKIKPSNVLKMMVSQGSPFNSKGFEMNDEGKITGWPEQ